MGLSERKWCTGRGVGGQWEFGMSALWHLFYSLEISPTTLLVVWF
jgi:hypothetical protein